MSSHHARVPVPEAPEPTSAPVDAPPRRTAAADALVPAAVSAPEAAPGPVGALTVGHAADPAEHAADALADAALSRLRASSSDEAHRHDPGCGHLRRSATPASSGASASATIGYEGGDLDPTATSRIESKRGGGAPLPGGVRRRMETAFGTGLGHVRVHDGPDAAALSSSISADAFTTGSDIFFGAGRFAPDSAAGERMLAHEIAHVVTEGGPAVHRWPWSKKLTPQEQADKDRLKAEEKAKAAAVKKSKNTEKTEKAQLAQSRTEGVQARSDKEQELYAGGREAAQAKVTDMYKRMTEAREREFAVFEEMQQNNVGGTDEQRATLVYQQVWYVEYPDLTKYRPARETPAEVLVAQVRQSRGMAQAGVTAAERDAQVTQERLLPAKVETLYDRMVVVRDELLAADPDASEFLVMEEARERVLAGLDPKALAELPPKDGPLDQAAWMAAGKRDAARKRQAERNAENVKANLMLLDPAQRLTPQTESAPIGQAVGEKLEVVGKYGGLGMTGLDKVGGGIAGKVGGKQDEELRKHLPKDDDPESPVPSFLDPLGVGDAYTSGAKAAKMKKAGERDEVDKNLPTSEATKAAAGIGNITSILTSLFGAVQSALGMAQQIEASWSTKDPYEGLKAAKSGSAMLTGLVNASKEAANLAKTIDSSVASGVKSVVPGLDIATSALAMVSGVTDVATSGMRQRETDNAMFEARAGSTDKVNVMVYPLMKVSQVYTKQLEQSCWTLGASILDFSLSVAQVASAGGFGIPAAIKASAAVLDKLHSLAHYIADKVLATQAKRAQKESAVLHLEGAAEDELKKHPKMAVDGIVMRAAQGDTVALAFLANYRIDGKPITRDYVAQIKPKPRTPVNPKAPEVSDLASTSNDALLLKVRETVLAGMDVEADPQGVFDDLKAQLDQVTGKGASLRDGWREAGDLRTQRNELAGQGKLGANTKGDRGIFWQLRMTLSTEKRGMLKGRTEAYTAGVEALPAGVACAVGPHELPENATDAQSQAFLAQLTVQDLEAELGRTPRRNSPGWIAFLRDALKEKKTAGATPTTPAPVTAPAGQP